VHPCAKPALYRTPARLQSLELCGFVQRLHFAAQLCGASNRHRQPAWMLGFLKNRVGIERKNTSNPQPCAVRKTLPGGIFARPRKKPATLAGSGQSGGNHWRQRQN
jgi:hypothetical protein